MLEVEVDRDTEVIVNTNVEVTAGNMNVAIIEDTNDIEVTVNRQEYVITGDEIYIPKRFEDAPTWMQELITQVVDTSISAQIQDLNEISMSLESMIDAMEVAKNTYELSIISSNDIDQRINTAVTTLNSSMEEADATILEVAQTRTTPEEAATIAIDVISAQLGSTTAGTIGASVSELQTAIANEEEARSTSIEVLTSSIEGAFDVNATAMNYLNTYVGLDEAGASTGTGLSGYLEGTDGQIGSAGSQLINDIELKAGEVESKFAYNSTVTLNGVTHTSGFGIATTIDSENIPEGESQFWISADEFKVVGANQTAEAKGPFTVNTTTGDITFNGEVTFNAVDAVYADTIVDNTTNNNNVFAQRLGYLNYAAMVAAAANGQTIINGGYLRTSLIQANAINANQINTIGLVAENISSTTIDGKTITGSFINGAIIVGATIRASYLDLDGEIEVLTDFYLCVNGNTTGVPTQAITEGRYRTYSASDIDAVPSSGYVNLYRIPTLSNITASSGFTSLNNGQTLYATLFSYNTANANSNKKVRKKRPTFNQGSGLMYSVSGFSTTGTSYATANDGGSYSLMLGNTTLFTFSFSSFAGVTGGSGGHGVCQTSFTWSKYGGASGAQYSSGRYNQYNPVQETEGYSQTFTVSQTVTEIPVIGDVNITATIIVTPYLMVIDGGDQTFHDWSFPYSVDHTITCLSSSYELPFDWTNTSDRVYWRKNDAISGGQIKFLNLSINNMI